MKDHIDFEIRRQIYSLISKNPGLHLSKIAKILNARISHVEYHLLYLKKHQLIQEEKGTGYVRYYCKGEVSTRNKKILTLLQLEIPLIIVLFLIKNENSRHVDILKSLDISRSTLSYHLKKLVKHGYLKVKEADGERRYSVNNKEGIIRLLIQYKPYNLIDNFRDLWSDITLE